MTSGSLTVVGTGIRLVSQTTPEARAHIERAQKVLALVAEPATSLWIEKLNPNTESLHAFYSPGKDRHTTYEEMITRVLSLVREGLHVCVASYGHPGVFAYPLRESIRRAREEGYSATMLPGVSAEDCLFADLGVDPGEHGCQSFEATDFLVYNRKFDTSSSLILWQIGLVGEVGYKEENGLWSEHGLRVLVDVLRQHYGASHEAVVYEAAQYPVCDPIVQRVALASIVEARITPISTLYVPPKVLALPDMAMVRRLGIPLPDLREKR
jgi:hypothetical protein